MRHKIICPHCKTEVTVSVKLRPRKKRGKKFVPPTQQECRNYAAEKEYHINPDFFFEYFDDSGWVDSKGNKVLNWKQKMRTWHVRNKDKEPAYQGRRIGDSRRKKKRRNRDGD